MKYKRKSNSFKNIITGINITDPVINKFEEFSKNKSLYKEINKYGYKLFSLSLDTINLINVYGPQNISVKLHESDAKVSEVIKNVDFNNESDIYDKTRMAATFYRIEELKKVDILLYDIVISAANDIKTVSELEKWFNSDPSNVKWLKCLFITLNFLISTPCNPKKKKKDGIQGFHSDYPIMKKLNDDGSNNEYYKNNYPLSVIIALQDDTYFRFLSNSHNQFDNNGETNVN